VVNVGFVAVTLTRALKGRFAEHRRIAPYTWWIWMYVSVTGVLVYFMLYHWFR
jgi:putative membrane protein